MTTPGALQGVRVVELGGIGPAPFAGMLLADMGADLVRVDRVGSAYHDILIRGKRSLLLDLRQPAGKDIALDLVRNADALVEGFRPGVLERLGFAPETCWGLNPALVIGRVTGWGQSGPLAMRAGHDINYVALSGVLHAIGPRERPAIPLNLVGDYGGGGLLLAFGMLCALLEARTSGRGQVVDAAMVDGAALLMTKWYAEISAGRWNDTRASNHVDGGSHFYRIYETADGKHLAVGALEDQFYARLLAGIGLDPSELPAQRDPASWPELSAKFAELFRQRTRDEWMAVFGDDDACVTPVLSLGEAPAHPHNVDRGTFVEVDGMVQPAPAPRLSRTPAHVHRSPRLGEDTDGVLKDLGLTREEIRRLRSDGVVA